MRVHTYVVEHDVGFAPNPYGRACTLACCKPVIRKGARLGDLIIGTGSKADKNQGNLVYWMKVDEILTFDQYWLDPRFRQKRAAMNGSLRQIHGDNIYHRDPTTGAWIQEDSFHSFPNGVLSPDDLKRDTGRTDRVLLSREFAYWGRAGPRVPAHLSDFVMARQGQKNHFAPERIAELEKWLAQFPERGAVGLPARWAV
jgi:hypothetical protein